MVKGIDDAKAAFEQIKTLKIKGYLPSAILVEETIEIQQELYVSLSLDRKSKTEVLIFSEAGGMNIEEVDKNQIKVININPIVGLQNYQLNQIFLNTELTEEIRKRAKETLKELYQVFKTNKLELLEINPMIVTPEGELICLDAKIIIDDNLYHKNDNKVASMTSTNMSFEEMTKAIGVNGVELNGDIAVITSGAGLGLATIDAINYHGGKTRSFVDLGPLVYDKGKMKEVIELVYSLKPKVVLFNFYFQVARCDTLAEAVVNSLTDIPVIVRARGKHEKEAKYLLEQNGCYVTEDFQSAVLKTIEMVSEGSIAYGNIS